MEDRAGIHRFMLGLPDDASPDEMKSRAHGVLGWLGSANIPDALQPWAEAQQDLVEEILEALGPGDTPAPAAVAARPVPQRTAAPGRNAAPRRATIPGLPRVPILPTAPIAVAAVLAIAIVAALLWRTALNDVSSPASPAGPSQSAEARQLMQAQQARLAELEQMVAADPQDAAALFELGESYIQAESWEKAIEWFTKLLEVDPTDLHALTDVGTASMNLGRYPEAEEAFMKVLELDPDNVQAHYNAGFLYAFTGEEPDVDKAVYHWREVTRLSPDSELGGIARVHIEQFAGNDGTGGTIDETPAPGVTPEPTP